MLTFKELMERINIAKTKMGDVIKDFQDSDAPQFKGKSAEKRRQMAIAAKLEADRGVKEETDLEEGSYKEGETRMGSVGPITTDAERAERAKKYREKMMKKEEAEQIDELSKKTLGSYLKKATADDAGRPGMPFHDRAKGRGMAARKVHGGKGSVTPAKVAATNEEAEQIDELSTGTLQSYRKKARAQGNAIVDKMKMGGGDWSKDQKDTKTLRKRAAGAQMSGKKLLKRGEPLRKEEVESIDEISTNLAIRARSKALSDTSGKDRSKLSKLALDKWTGKAKVGSGKYNTNEEVELDEGRMKEISMDMETMGDKEFKAKHRKSKSDMQKALRSEELKGNQHKIDANKNGKVDSNDFKILRNAKKARYQ